MAETAPKTILLVFIHGFKGDDTTFSAFPTHLTDRLSAELASRAIQTNSSNILQAPSSTTQTPLNTTPPTQSQSLQPPNVIPLLYPSFETRGDLSHTVARLRAWLLEKVIDAEVARGTPSPTVTPGVGVVLVGHSMGGIVAADAVLGIATEFWDDRGKVDEEERARGVDGVERELNEQAESGVGQDQDQNQGDSQRGTMFPKILGVLAFDTPYLGIAPGVVKYGAEEQYRQGKTWYDGASGLFAASKWGKSGANAGTVAEVAPATAKSSAWSSWGKTALLASAGVAAASGAAYAGRQYLGSGFNWVTSHLAFINCLAREQDLRKRFAGMVMLAERGIHPSTSPSSNTPTTTTTNTQTPTERVHFSVFYTLLDPRATALPDQTARRTFCRLPRAGPSDAASPSSSSNSSTADSRSASAPPAAFSSPPSSSTLSPSSSSSTVPTNQTPNIPTTQENIKDSNWHAYWVHATNSKAANEVSAHVGMFEAKENPEYGGLVEASAEALGRWVAPWGLTRGG